MPDMRVRPRVASIRFSAREHAALKAAAKKRRWSLSLYVQVAAVDALREDQFLPPSYEIDDLKEGEVHA